MLVSLPITITSVAAAIVLGSAMRVVSDQQAGDEVPVIIHLPKDRAELCLAQECTVMTQEDLSSVVAAAAALQRKQDAALLDSSGCLRGGT